METIEQPAVLAMPFANNGTKNALPTAATGTGAASLAEGFPLLTSTSITDNGIPPSRADMNGLGYVSTAYAYLMQCGGVYTYRDDVATTIGGYPLNALLWYIPTNGIPNLLRSTIANNTNNFNDDSSVIGNEGSGKPWEIVTVSPTNFVTTNTAQTIGGVKTFSSSPVIPTATTGDSSTKAASTEFVTGAINTINNAVVHKTGNETITGVKTLKNTEATIANPPNNVSWRYTDYTDNNNERVGVIGSQINPNGWHGTYLQAGNEGNINIITNGTDVITYAPACDADNSIVTTVSINKSATGGTKLGSGVIMNWGTLTSGKTITYKIPFTGSDTYALVFNNNSGTDGYGRGDIVTSKSSTSATVDNLCENPIRWLAIGY